MAGWSKQADIVVVGFSGAGSAVALTARRMGLQVVVVGKQYG